MIKISSLPLARKGYLLFLLLVLVACNSCQSQKEHTTHDSYTTREPHPDGTGKVYMGREIANVMSASGGGWLERSTRQEEEDVALSTFN